MIVLALLWSGGCIWLLALLLADAYPIYSHLGACRKGSIVDPLPPVPRRIMHVPTIPAYPYTGNPGTR